MGDIVYTPALGLGHYHMLKTKRRSYDGYDLSFWKDNSPYKHKHILFSTAYGLETPNFRESMDIGDDVFFIADSGGYQIYTQNMNLKPKQIMNWMENNANQGFVLDIPGTVTKEKIIKTKENIKEMINCRTNSNFKFYNVLHGKDYNTIKNYHNEMKEFDNDLDGWGTGSVQSSNNFLLALNQSYISKISEVNHVLGVSGTKTIPIIYYIAKKYGNKKVTFDSSSYSQFSINRVFLLNMKDKINMQSKVDVKLKKLPCKCEVCVTFQDKFLPSLKDPSIMDLTQAMVIFTLHNLKVYLDYCEFVDVLTDDREIMINHFSNGSDRFREVIDFIDLSYEKGLEVGYNKYKRYFSELENIQQQTTQKQKGVFDY